MRIVKHVVVCVMICLPVLLESAAEALPESYPIETIVISVSPLDGAGTDGSKWPHPVQSFIARDISAHGAADLTGTLNRKAAGVTMVNSQANPYQPTILYHGFEISPI